MKTHAVATHETLEEDFNRLKQGQKIWCKRPLEERLLCLQRFFELLKERKEELAKVLTRDTGKPITQSRREIEGARDRIRFFLDHSEQWLSPKTQHETLDIEEILAYEPLGVVCNISAWNYPYLIGVNVFVPALIAGNAVFYKPSSYTNETGLRIQECLYEAGVNEDVFITVIGDRGVAQHLLEMPFHGYFFTGSTQTGQLIAQKVAPKLVPVGLELGGKDPLYVADDIENIQRVAEACVDGAFYNNGQSCCSVERIYIHEKIFDAFVKNFVEVTTNLKMGDPMDEETYLGPLTQTNHVAFLNTQLEDALIKGAALLCGGKGDERQRYFKPTVLTNVNHTMCVMKEETFGPLIGLQKVSGDAEAVQMMDDTEYGLTAAVYTTDLTRGEDILSQLEAGTGYINCCDRVSPHLPWSGRRNSGIGSTLSYLGILAFVQPKGYHIRGL